MKEQLKKAKAIIEGYDGPAVRVMEVCGTHTHEIFHLGVRKILPPQVELISGPGCPVCVTPAGFIDEAVWLALEKECNDLYLWRSGSCAGKYKESCRCQKSWRQDSDGLLSDGCL